MNMLSLARLVVVGTLCLFSYVSSADDPGCDLSNCLEYDWPKSPFPQHDDKATREALLILFAASNVEVPETSTCWDYYVEIKNGKKTIKEKPMIKDILATRMTGLHNGKIAIDGKCESGFCLISIFRDAGETPSSIRIRFGVQDGKLNPAKLGCVTAP
jgi:hypothetical protein